MDPVAVPAGSAAGEVTSGVGYAYSVPGSGDPSMQPKFYHPWSSYQPPPFSSDSNDSQPGLALTSATHDTRQTAQPEPGHCSQSVSNEKLAVSPPPSRERFSYTRYQVELLNAIFSEIRYPNSMQKQLIAKRLGITRDQVKIWFQNRRRKDVMGKAGKEDLGERTMVSDQVLDSILSELQSFQDDPKGRRLRPVAKGRRRSVRQPSSPDSEDSQPGGAPAHPDPPAALSEPYRPNLMYNGRPPAPGYLSHGHNTPHLVYPAASTSPVAALGLTPPFGTVCYPGSNLSHESSVMPQPLLDSVKNGSPSVLVPEQGPLPGRRSLDLFPVAFESIPMPVAGQSTALPVTSPGNSPSSTTMDKNANTKVLTMLSATDESSNDSSYSHAASVASSDNQRGTSPTRSAADPLDIKAPPNVVAPAERGVGGNQGHGVKRSRSDASSNDDEEEPPRKKQEYQPLLKSEEETAPPNKTAPPSEPLRFDLSKLRSPTSAADGATTSKPSLQTPTADQPWLAWTGRPIEPKVTGHAEVKVPIPVRATPDGDFCQYSPYSRFGPLSGTLKPSCGPDMSWPSYYGVSAGIHQPWDYTCSEPHALDINKPDPLGSLGPSVGHDPHGVPWLVPSYGHPYCPLAPPPITNAADKHK